RPRTAHRACDAGRAHGDGARRRAAGRGRAAAAVPAGRGLRGLTDAVLAREAGDSAVLRGAGLRADEPGLLLELLEDGVEDVRRGGVRLVDLVVHGAHGARGLLD